MPKYVIERELPGAGLVARNFTEILGVLRNLVPSIQWVESFVTHDKIYCV